MTDIMSAVVVTFRIFSLFMASVVGTPLEVHGATAFSDDRRITTRPGRDRRFKKVGRR
jgi:hypothetical protein